jgi:hypothetical protein
LVSKELKTDKEKPRQMYCRGFPQGRYGRGLATESNTVCNIVDHVTVQTDVCQFACVKLTQRSLGLVLNAQSAKKSKNFGYDHFITYFKPAEYSASHSVNRQVLTEIFRIGIVSWFDVSVCMGCIE